MLPMIRPGDYAAVDMSYYVAHPVRRFEMVVFKLAEDNIPRDLTESDRDTIYLQRVVGLGGETLEIKGGRIYINGQQLNESFNTVPLNGRGNFGPVTIPDGEYFLMGDNRPNSMDSRYWARPTLRQQSILGKVVEIFPQQ